MPNKDELEELARAMGLRFGSPHPEPGSADTYYVPADLSDGSPVLLRIRRSAASELLPGAWREVARVSSGSVVEALPFGPTDRENVRLFAERIEPAFLPRPQRARAAIAAGNRHPEISLPAAFEAFSELLREAGRNLASTVQLSATREMTTDEALARRSGDDPVEPGHTRVSIRHLYHAGLWAAIRSGFRDGYTAEADHIIISGATPDEIAHSIENGKEAIRHASGYTKFTTDTSRLFELRADTRHPQPWTAAEVRELFETQLPAEERKWVLAEFARPFSAGAREYRFQPEEIERLAVKFGPSLLLNEELFDFITQVKGGQPFDFEPSLDEADTLTTAKELIFCMHWLKERGRPAQLLPPNLGFKKRQGYPESMEHLAEYAEGKMWPELVSRVAREYQGRPVAELQARVNELAGVAECFDATLSIHSGSGKQPEVLRSIGQATHGRVNYKISGELQLQLFDVLAEQPAKSPERALYDRMVERCEKFAVAGAFGHESELAAHYRALGRGSYLGAADKGRGDGNLFLVFWLGNLVGSKDSDGVFFKDKLDRLPGKLVEEVRRRNKRYIKWLAGNLQ